jgi:hypothetical protein
MKCAPYFLGYGNVTMETRTDSVVATCRAQKTTDNEYYTEDTMDYFHDTECDAEHRSDDTHDRKIINLWDACDD